MKSTEAGAHEILGEMSDKEYLARRAIAGTKPRLNRVFEELGIHHEEHDVPVKVHKYLEDKARKAAAKNTTAAAEAKKRKGAGASKIVRKNRRTWLLLLPPLSLPPLVLTRGVVENVGGGTASMDVGTEGEGSATDLDLGGDNFIETAL